jgi:hypothetical protein
MGFIPQSAEKGMDWPGPLWRLPETLAKKIGRAINRIGVKRDMMARYYNSRRQPLPELFGVNLLVDHLRVICYVGDDILFKGIQSLILCNRHLSDILSGWSP